MLLVVGDAVKEVEETAALDADDRTLGQKVSLIVFTSIGERR